ncbi:MAG: class A beta-lactamase [Sphingomonadales bacterium]
MPMRFTRRHLLAALPASPALAADRWAPLRAAVAKAEADAGGRLGLAVLDSGSGARFQHRGAERFPLCSTFKLLLAARLLHGADRGEWALTDRLPVTAADMLQPAPLTGSRIGGTASLAELAGAMVMQSDNPAANLGLKRVGGPAALTGWLRGLGDTTTRLDRYEPQMNNEVPDDPRDTTTPLSMLATSRRLLTGTDLSDAARAQLAGWMAASTTADTMLRAGLPPGWREANKTGAGADRARNIMAVITPPGRAPVFVAAYLFGKAADLEARNAYFPPLARALVAALA